MVRGGLAAALSPVVGLLMGVSGRGIRLLPSREPCSSVVLSLELLLDSSEA